MFESVSVLRRMIKDADYAVGWVDNVEYAVGGVNNGERAVGWVFFS